MIERIPDEINLQTGSCGDTQFDIIPKETFAMMCRKVNEIIDHTNAHYEAIQRIIGRQHRHLSDDHKKPKSTNIALRQRIAELEKENAELKRKLKKQDDEDNLYDSFLKKLPLFADK
ncbi:MAG: hypothetical protein J6R99_01815 [Alphaproteobacteria bacterium]|nr:hypothetical protein [Alphaproteobacteria bacterium]